ncbi:TPM domain-containing protein [Aquabacterium sp.]|uniref:TPM domain-containing protein n=1 Tax=Aquabacterium sp. TaxID=1872578 RepID=UPI0035B05406
MPRWKRILTHRWFDERDARRLLDHAALSRLTEHVRRSEQLHDGEIRLCIESALPWRHLWQDVSARQRAAEIFSELRVWDTEHNNGVLIYLLLAEHAIEIVADRGLGRITLAPHWHAVLADAQQHLRQGAIEQGLQVAVDGVSQVLQSAYPPQGHKPGNQLPDAPDLR